MRIEGGFQPKLRQHLVSVLFGEWVGLCRLNPRPRQGFERVTVKKIIHLARIPHHCPKSSIDDVSCRT
jgi:hypothetical protein